LLISHVRETQNPAKIQPTDEKSRFNKLELFSLNHQPVGLLGQFSAMGHKSAKYKRGTRRPNPKERTAGIVKVIVKSSCRIEYNHGVPIQAKKVGGGVEFSCQSCGKGFKTKGACSTHSKTCGSFACTQCGKCFVTLPQLHGHTSNGRCRMYTKARSKRGAPPSKEVASLKTRGVGYGYPREHRVLPTPTLYDFEDCVVFIDREVTATDLIEKPRQLSRDQIESEVHTYTHIIHCFTCLLAYLPNSPCVLSLKGFKTIWARLLRGGNVRGLRCQQ